MKKKTTEKTLKILALDPTLAPYRAQLIERSARHAAFRQALAGAGLLADFADGHLTYGIHRTEGGWRYREWAPGADAVSLAGDFNGWDRQSHPLTRLPGGDWALQLAGEDALKPGQRVLASLWRDGRQFDRIPAYIRSVARDPESGQFTGRIASDAPYPWRDADFLAKPRSGAPIIYECHIGMAQEQEGIGSYRAFAEVVLPRVKAGGYNAVQLMAIAEHPYYASFGYQVTNLFAPSAWYGPPEDLKALIDRAHELGLRVLLDIVHSHTSKNHREGLADFDGSGAQYCAGEHPAWGSMLFDYQKPQVLRLLLSNLRYWLEEFHFDGFRFDGVTSMLYRDHGLNRTFSGYAEYFSDNVNDDAALYLTLANELVHSLRRNALTIAEDVSGMPGMCLPISQGGFGFDYRLNMGVPDLWIRLLTTKRDEDWDLFMLWHELTTRRAGEKRIGYAESHDQALVGDKTLLFRMLDAEMYTGMHRAYASPTMDRAMALIRLIRMLSMTLAGEGWLNFMGNEFGHPEWIDFPREGNGWSHHYARRQWSLADHPDLKYGLLAAFDRALIRLAKRYGLLGLREARSLWIDPRRQILAYAKGRLVFAFNLHPTRSYPDFFLPNLEPGAYRVAFDSDEAAFGGQARIAHDVIYEAAPRAGQVGFAIYLPARTALALLAVRK